MPRLFHVLPMLCAAPLAAQAPVLYRPDSTPPAQVRVDGVVTVPLVASGSPRAPLPVVEAMVNGHGPFRFGIETGAHFVALSPAIIDSLGLTTTGGPPESPEYRVDSITIGSATFSGVPITALGGASGVDGLLGWPFWSGVTVTIDAGAHQLRITRDSLPAPDGNDILPLARVGDFWGFPVRVAGHDFTAIVDTRSTGAIGFTPEAGKTLPFLAPPRVIGQARGVAIPVTDVTAAQLDGDLVIGEYRISHPLITMRALPPDFPTAPIVGEQILSTFVVTLDIGHARMRLTRAAAG